MAKKKRKKKAAPRRRPLSTKILMDALERRVDELERNARWLNDEDVEDLARDVAAALSRLAMRSPCPRRRPHTVKGCGWPCREDPPCVKTRRFAARLREISEVK